MFEPSFIAGVNKFLMRVHLCLPIRQSFGRNCMWLLFALGSSTAIGDVQPKRADWWSFSLWFDLEATTHPR